MSNSTLYGVTKDLGYEYIKEYKNSWGSHPVVWNFYSKIEGFGQYFTGKEFWKKYHKRLINEETPISERLVIYLTYYPTAIHRSCFEELAKGLKEISEVYNKTYNNERINHLETIANDILKLDKEYDYICLKGTSCDDLYEFCKYIGEPNEDGDYEDSDWITNLKEIEDKKVKNDFGFAFIENGKLVYKELLGDEKNE